MIAAKAENSEIWDVEGNRYVDRYYVRHGEIVKMEVWNDSAEWLLVRAGLAKP